MTSEEYFNKFIYDCDYATPDEICYNAVTGRSLTNGNISEIYPGTIIVESGKNKTSPDAQDNDWRSLRIVFEKDGAKWYLVGIIHDQWKL